MQEVSGIAAIDRRLLDWASLIAPKGLCVSFDVPVAASNCVFLYLLDFTRDAVVRGSQKSPFQITLRYLVTTICATQCESHELLWSLLIDAESRQEKREWTVDLDPAPLPLWQALGIAPRASFFLRVPLRHDWAMPDRPLVRSVELRTPDLRPVHGIVKGPGAEPLAGALVSIPNLRISAYTDKQGYFSLPSVPCGTSAPTVLLVRARGREQTIELNLAGPIDAELCKTGEDGFASDNELIQIDFAIKEN